MQKWPRIIIPVTVILFPFSTLFIGLRNLNIFDAPLLIKNSPLPLVILALAISLAVFRSIKSGDLYDNLNGILLFFSFTIGYFLLASIFNKQSFNTNNIYFAADSGSWYLRMADKTGWSVASRAVHPLVHIIFRPAIVFISLFTGGDRFYANLLLLALAGGGCVFIAWKIIKYVLDDGIYAALFSALLGITASHLVFSSVVESYIFSAFFLLIFIWLLITARPFYLQVVVGVFTLGITITNLIQQGITFILTQRNLWRTFAFGMLVILFSVGINIFSRMVYPVTEYFFLPQNLTDEQRFSQDITFKRAGLLVENLLIYNVTAPQPYFSLRNDMPRFNFLNGTIHEYIWFGWPALILWLFALCLAFYQFIKNIRSDNNIRNLSIALLLCLAFNFLLHVGYGNEPFLYTADWTYAIILFAAINLYSFTKRTNSLPLLFALLLSVFINNLWLVYLLAGRVSQFFLN